MLGVGDFYYELGVQVIEVCLATSHRNGGMYAMGWYFRPGGAIVSLTYSPYLFSLYNA